MIIRTVNFGILSRHFKEYQDGIVIINDKKSEFISKLEPLKKSMEEIIILSQNGQVVTELKKNEYSKLQSEAIEIDNDFKFTISKMNDELSKKVYASLNIIITDWANINDVDIVISDSEVVIAKTGVDITERILEVIKEKELYV